jgi:hypothetical protein
MQTRDGARNSSLDSSGRKLSVLPLAQVMRRDDWDVSLGGDPNATILSGAGRCGDLRRGLLGRRANQSDTTQRTVSGAGIGAAAGLGIGALAGARLTGLAWGTGIGAASGFLWDQYKKSEGEN